MTNSLKYIEYDGFPVVSARDMYSLLTDGNGENVSAWLIFCTESPLFKEGKDYFRIKTPQGHLDYLLLPITAGCIISSSSFSRKHQSYTCFEFLRNLSLPFVDDKSEENSFTEITISEAAKIINYEGAGPNEVFKVLKDAKILMPSNVPYQKYINRGFFKLVESTYRGNTGEIITYGTTYVTSRGIEYIKRILQRTKTLAVA